MKSVACALLIAAVITTNSQIASAQPPPGIRSVSELPNSRYSPTDRVVALTFDDGPDPTYTPEVLAILAQFDAKATFFQVGREAERRPELDRQIIGSGSSVQNHTWNHADLTRLAAGSWSNEVDRTTSLLQTNTGSTVNCLRPPYGASNPAVVDESTKRNLVPVLWSADTSDWKRPGVDSIVRDGLLGLRPGSIILMHDGGGDRSETIAALPTILKRIKEQGYKFVSLCGQPLVSTEHGFSVDQLTIVPSAFTGTATGTRHSWRIAESKRSSEFKEVMPPRKSALAYDQVVPTGAQYYGAPEMRKTDLPIIGVITTSTRNGYWMVNAGGGVFAFGDARFLSSVGGKQLTEALVAGSRNYKR